MPKRKKYPKLPNGYGSIRFLGKNRRNCYAVHPPAEIETGTGRILRQKPICYVDAWIKGFTVLTAYKAGTYTPVMEKVLEIDDTDDLTGLFQRIPLMTAVILFLNYVKNRRFFNPQGKVQVLSVI